MPKILQDARKRDDKARTFALPDNNKMEDFIQSELNKLKKPDDLTELDSIRREFAKVKSSEDLERDKFLENINKYESINLNDVNNLIDEIRKNITMGDNVVELGDNKYVYFNDLNNFLYNIKNGEINNFNKEEKYEKKFKNIENKLANRKKYGKYIKLYIEYLNNLKRILFSNKKSSGKGLTISSLPILLSKLNIKNSRELTNDIKNLLKYLYDNKQITKLVYNNLIKAITFKNDS